MKPPPHDGIEPSASATSSIEPLDSERKPEEFESADTSARSITLAVLVQLLARAGGMIASIVTVAITTRQLGVTDYGLLTTAIVFVALWSSLTELGISAVIVRRVSAGDGDLARLSGVNLGLSLVYCIPLSVVAALAGLLVYHDRAGVHGVLVVVCGSLLLTAIANCWTPIFLSRMRFGPVALADVLCRLGTLAATVAVVHFNGGLIWFGVVQLVPPLVEIVVLSIAARGLTALRPYFDRAETWSLVRESLPQTGVLIIAVLYWRADAVILTLFGTVRDVGAYGLAYTIAFTLSAISTFYLASTLSTMSARFAADRDWFARFVSDGVEMMLFLGLPIAVFGAILARPIVGLLAAAEFTGPASMPLSLLLAGVALTFLTGVLSQALFAAHDQTFLLRLNIVNLVINIALNLALVPAFGAVGAASALLVSEFSGLVVTMWRLHAKVAFSPPWRFLVHLLIPLAAGAGVGVLLRSSPVLLALVAVGATYLVANVVLGPIRPARIRAALGQDGEPSATGEVSA